MPTPEIDMALWGDRMQATAPDAPLGTLRPALDSDVPLPICIQITAEEIGQMTAKQFGPYEYNQYVLGKLKAFGAPVEGVLHLKLAHGAVARVKPSAANPQDFFQWMWLAEPYVRAIAAAGRTC